MHINLSNFSDFCRQNTISWSIDYSRQKSLLLKKAKSLMDRNLDDDPLAQTYEFDGLKLRITPSKDFYRGVPTILNSETAALMVAEKLFNEQPAGKLFKDPDFGPKDAQDFKGSW